MNTYEYDIWGNLTSKTEAMPQPYRYAGEPQDDESGLIYLRARYYDPTVARFLTEDMYTGQIDNPLTLNLYTYVGNNPLTHVDPTGHMTWKAWWYEGRGEQDEFFSQGWQSVKSIFKKQTYQLIGAVMSGDISVSDLAEAFGNEIAEALEYQADHMDSVLNGEPTKDEAYAYGRAVGKVEIGMFALSSAGTAAAVLTGKLALKLAEKAPSLLAVLRTSAKTKDLVPSYDDDYFRVGPSETALQQHREYVRQHGTIESPIDVKLLKDGTMQIMNGHHRWQIAKDFGLKTVPIVIKEIEK